MCINKAKNMKISTVYLNIRRKIKLKKMLKEIVLFVVLFGILAMDVKTVSGSTMKKFIVNLQSDVCVDTVAISNALHPLKKQRLVLVSDVIGRLSPLYEKSIRADDLSEFAGLKVNVNDLLYVLNGVTGGVQFRIVVGVLVLLHVKVFSLLSVVLNLVTDLLDNLLFNDILVLVDDLVDDLLPLGILSFGDFMSYSRKYNVDYCHENIPLEALDISCDLSLLSNLLQPLLGRSLNFSSVLNALVFIHPLLAGVLVDLKLL